MSGSAEWPLAEGPDLDLMALAAGLGDPEDPDDPWLDGFQDWENPDANDLSADDFPDEEDSDADDPWADDVPPREKPPRCERALARMWIVDRLWAALQGCASEVNVPLTSSCEPSLRPRLLARRDAIVWMESVLGDCDQE